MSLLGTVRAQPNWLWLVCLLVAVWAFSPSVFKQLPPDRYAVINVDRLVSDDDAAQSDFPAGEWQAASLPDSWISTAADSRQVWYWLDPVASFGKENANQHPGRQSEPWALYIPHLAQNAAIYLNGEWLGQGGSMQDPIARNWNQPLLFAFDANRIRPGRNALLIQVRSSNNGTGYLGRVYFAPLRIIQPYYDRQFHQRVTLERWVTGALLLFGLFILALWFFRRHDTLYLWYSTAAFCWAAHEFNLFLVEVPFSDAVWEALVVLTLGWSILFIVFFVHRFVGKQAPRIERAMILFGTLLAVPLAWPDENWVRFYGYLIWLPLLFPIGLYANFTLMRSYAETRRRSIAVLTAAGWAMLILAAHDLLVANLLWQREDAHLLQFAALTTIAIIAALLVRRFVNALNTAEALTEELEARVAARERELEANHRKLRILEREKVLADERERLMRDIHDGVGGQLVAALSVIEHSQSLDESLASIRAALADLRLVIDSLDSDARDLNTVLGMLRMRLNDQLRHAPLEFKWRVGDIPEIDGFGPRKALQVMRIIQEALTNALKHAQASELSVSTELRQLDGRDGVCICVADNGPFDGSDFDSEAQRNGRGLKNQRHRAASIDARICWENAGSGSASGTRVVLWLPLCEA